MPPHKIRYITSKLILILLLIIQEISSDCVDDILARLSEKECPGFEVPDLWRIRSTQGNFVLDASDPNTIRIQPYQGSPMQLWKFLPGSKPGLFRIINSGNGKTLDWMQQFNGDTSLITVVPNGSLRQEWFLNGNGRIMNGENGRNVDISNARFQAGNPVGIWNDNGNKAQEFVWEKFEI